jgi:glycosyltransferase involved in cell wall biosynthesis
LRILYIHRDDIAGTGVSTHAGQLIGAFAEKHKIKIYRNITDFDQHWDIVHALNLKHLNTHLLEKIHAPLIIDVHDAHWAAGEACYPLPDMPLRRIMAMVRRRRYEPALRRASAIIVHSDYVAKRLALEKTRVVPLAIEKIQHGRSLQERPPLVIFAGRDYFRKGLPVLLKAWKNVISIRPDAMLEIAGREFIHGRIYARMFASHGSIALLGGISREELLARIRNARALALPSWNESFGIVLLEAMACGTPAIGANAGGVPEALRGGEGGLLFEPGNARALASAIIKCLECDRIIDGIIKRGFAIAAQHSVDAMSEKVEKIYKEILGL